MSSELLISDSKPRPEGLRKLCEAALLITISLFLLLLLPYLNCSRYKLRCLDDDCKFKLLAEVITHKPNVDLSTWDRIAYDMNQFVYDRRICADRSFFYDGSSCYQVFRKSVATRTL
ncbi:ALI_collapsed_G0026290.mRNA.1.CDS.1 [Saccharomyces cerevisiae]|nr:ALI_collapsed_G0026290.mRNA.1.CDS.1 [Saccharomyces cerevisiae]